MKPLKVPDKGALISLWSLVAIASFHVIYWIYYMVRHGPYSSQLFPTPCCCGFGIGAGLVSLSVVWVRDVRLAIVLLAISIPYFWFMTWAVLANFLDDPLRVADSEAASGPSYLISTIYSGVVFWRILRWVLASQK